MGIYRIHEQEVYVGCVVAKNKKVADAYAFGKYGAGTSTTQVAYSEALEATGICVLAQTRAVHTGAIHKSRAIRELLP